MARVVEALCRMERVGSLAKPNCAISFFVAASLALFVASGNAWIPSGFVLRGRWRFVFVFQPGTAIFSTARPGLSEFRRFC